MRLYGRAAPAFKAAADGVRGHVLLPQRRRPPFRSSVQRACATTMATCVWSPLPSASPPPPPPRVQGVDLRIPGGGPGPSQAIAAAAAASSAMATPRTAGDIEALLHERVQRDRYSGVTVNIAEAADTEGVEAAAFQEALGDALAAWRADGVRGVWLRLPLDRDDLIMAARACRMKYHHVRYDTDEPEYMMLCAWLVDTPNRLPAPVHHQIGVGGIVLSHDKTKVLAIKEKTGLRPGMRPFWKLPGGLVDRGEDIHQGAVREVWEETGIHTAFESFVGFRETHQAKFRNSDLYFVCVLRLDREKHPVDAAEPPQPTPCAQEISECAWLPVEQWRALPLNRRHTLIGELMMTALESALAEGRVGMAQAYLPSRMGNRESLYAPAEVLDRSTAKL